MVAAEQVPQPIFVATVVEATIPVRPDLLISRHERPLPMTLVDGLRLTTPAETLLAAARDLGVLDLVIMGDSALRLEHCSVDELEDTARSGDEAYGCSGRSIPCSIRGANRRGSR